jgi:hypothetical protein
MRPIPPRYSEYRVNILLNPSEIALCTLYGQEPSDFVRLALQEYVFQITKQWLNIQTYSVAFDIKRREDWREWAYKCDDYKEFISIAAKHGVDETSIGIRLKDSKVNRARLDKMLRAFVRRSSDEDRESFLLPHKLREKRSNKSGKPVDEDLGGT